LKRIDRERKIPSCISLNDVYHLKNSTPPYPGAGRGAPFPKKKMYLNLCKFLKVRIFRMNYTRSRILSLPRQTNSNPKGSLIRITFEIMDIWNDKVLAKRRKNRMIRTAWGRKQHLHAKAKLLFFLIFIFFLFLGIFLD